MKYKGWPRWRNITLHDETYVDEGNFQFDSFPLEILRTQIILVGFHSKREIVERRERHHI